MTTYRNFAEEITDRVARRIGFRGEKCGTRRTPLPGGVGEYRDTVDALDQCNAIRPESRAHLLRVYGSRAVQIVSLVEEQPRLGRVICPHSHMIAAEVIFCLRREFATTITDVLLRRSMAGLSRDLGRAALPRAINVARQYLGWSQQRADEEERRYLREIGRLSSPVG